MTEPELPRFREMFDELIAARLRNAPRVDERERAFNALWHALMPYPIGAVFEAFERLRASAKYWPMPADWTAAMPRTDRSASLELLTDEEAREYDEAERLAWDGKFCGCRECQQANATHLSMRFVPRLDRHGVAMKVLHPYRSQPVYAGEWIHGARLRAYYDEMGKFFALKATLEATGKIPHVAIGVTR